MEQIDKQTLKKIEFAFSELEMCTYGDNKHIHPSPFSFMHEVDKLYALVDTIPITLVSIGERRLLYDTKRIIGRELQSLIRKKKKMGDDELLTSLEDLLFQLKSSYSSILHLADSINHA